VRKRLYIANDDHTDYMWALDEQGVREALPRMLDRYMTQAETTATHPPDRRGRFNADGTLWVWEYERERGPAEVQRLWGHIRDGTVTVPMSVCPILYGAMPAEAVLRSLYVGGAYERREAVRLPLIVPMEDQTLPGGVASLWAGAGVRYAWKGICNCATRISAGNRPREIYRFTGPDGQSVLMKWQSLLTNNQGPGGYAEARDPHTVVETLTGDSTFLARWPYDVAAAFGYGWDDPESYTSAFLEAARDLSDTTRRVIVSNELDFFEDFEATHGAEVGAYGASFGNEWDLLTASMGAVTSSVKRAVERLRAAEALATVAELHGVPVMSGLASTRDSMNLACGLFYEHNWSGGPAVTGSQRADWQRRIAGAITGYVDLLHARALGAVAGLVRGAAGTERHLVFNPLSWSRTDVADLAMSGPGPFHVVDVATGAELPSQEVEVEGHARLRVRVADVPALGYRLVEVRPGAGATFAPSATVSLPAFDNGVYRVALGARGQLTSVVDHKDGDRQLVAAGDALFDPLSGSGAVTLVESGPVSTTLRVAAGGSPPREVRVTLHAGLDRIEVAGLVTGNFSGEVLYASRFAYTLPDTRHEEVGMIARVARKAEGGDYADENTRTDWLTLNHFVDIGEPARGAVLSATDSPFFSLGSSGPTTLDTHGNRLFTVVGMQVDGLGRGIADQGEDAWFPARFALRTRATWDPALAMRFALEHQNPLVAAPVTGSDDAPLAAPTWSMLAVDSPDVLVWTLKPAEEGISRGVIVRLWNVADGERQATLLFPGLPVTAAARVSHVETDLAPPAPLDGELQVTLARQQLGTWRLFADGGVLAVPAGAGGAPGLSVGPNPARRGAVARVWLALPAEARVRVTVHDLRGARVTTLLDARASAGGHRARWDTAAARPGVYFLRAEAAGRVTTRRVVVLE
jgi:alpha-mannosidase